MIKKFFTFCILIAVTAGLNVTPAQENAAAHDSVNIKQMIMNQIRIAEEKKARELEQSRIKKEKPAEAVQKGKAAGSILDLVPDGYLLKGFIIADALLSAILFVVWRRRKIKTQKLEKTLLKNNIIKLRQEKVGRKSHLSLDKKRKQIKLTPVYNAADDALINHARKLNVSVGELQLAARIQSYERERG